MQLVETNPLQFAFSTQTKPALTPLTTKEKKKKKTLHSHITTLLLLHHPPSVLSRPTPHVLSPYRRDPSTSPVTFLKRVLQFTHGSQFSALETLQASPLFSYFFGAESLKSPRVFELWAVCTWCLRPNAPIRVQDPMVWGFIKPGKEAMLVFILDFAFFYLVICFVSPFYFF